MKIGIITSGGDSPGMNPCIAEIVKNAEKLGHMAVGFEYGFLGIRENRIRRLTTGDIQGICKMGGSILKTSRLPELIRPDVQKELISVLVSDGIEALVVLGGDGSLKGADALSRMEPGINFTGIPCTIDNNIYKSEYTLGFDTAINKQTTYIDDILDTAISLPGRVFFIETLGAMDGYLAMSSYHMGMADLSVLTEREVSDEEIACAVEQAIKSRSFAVIVFAEGTYRMFETAKYVREKLGVAVKCNMIGYQQRGGSPTATERLHAAAFAKYSICAVHEAIFNKYVVYAKGKYEYVDLADAGNRKIFDWFDL